MERAARVVEHRLPRSVLCVVERAPDPSCAPWVRACFGYEERAAAPLVKHEFANTSVVVIFEIGTPIEVGEGAQAARRVGGFVARIHERPTRTAFSGHQLGVELLLSPLAAHFVFGVPPADLAQRVVSASDLLPREQRDLPVRLGELASWDDRLDAVERFVANARRAKPPAALRELAWAVAEIERHAGRVRIAALARELGWSERRLERAFAENVGVSPKLFARLARFEALMAHVHSGASANWADAALALGYADQSHLVRDVRQFAGVPPTLAEAQTLGVGRTAVA
ncbi:MAG: AraC family transcriptional regulator [Deltaproteobacteria bacterium]|nr:AraC family transcriptional regulator [Deltaproteobacteria bacterium]